MEPKLSKQQALELLSPMRDEILSIVKAADIDRSLLLEACNNGVSKSTLAGARHDAMISAAKSILGPNFVGIEDSRTQMFMCESYILRFKKMRATGEVAGFPTRRATMLKARGQLGQMSFSFFDQPANVAPPELDDARPIFYCGYIIDDDSLEIDEFAISYYLDTKPVWVLREDELFSDIAPIQFPVTEVARPRTTIRVKIVDKEDGEN